MRLLVLIFIFSLSLYAKGTDSCYTIQLKSAAINHNDADKLAKAIYPKECKIMQISNILTVRCGCYEKMDMVKEKLPAYKNKYKYAYIATSYKYRFIKRSKTSKIQLSNNPTSTKIYNSDEELKLMLQAFLYSNDLENAYKTAKIGYAKHPNSYYWNQKMAKISKWSGRGSEAIKYMKFMYYRKYNSKLAKDIIDYGLSDYQYEAVKDLVTREFKRNPDKTNIDKMIYVYTQIGEPEKAAFLLEKLYNQNKTKTSYLDKALHIYINMGDLNSAQKIVSKIEKNNLYTQENVKLISYFYYSKRDIPKAYKVLTKIDTIHYDKKLSELKSDLGWYLQKYKPASKASRLLIKMHDGRLVDYERVMATNTDTTKPLVNQMILEAYEKFGHSYMFYVFANNAIKAKHFTQLQTAIDRIDKKKSPLLKESNYWFIKARLYHHNNHIRFSKEAIEHALALNPNSMQVRFVAITMYEKYKMFDALNRELVRLTTDTTLSQEYYFPLASLCYSIHKINLASYYVDKLVQSKDSLTKTLEFKFLQADLYSAKNNKNAYLRKINEINVELKKDAIKSPNIATTQNYLNNLLRVQINLLTSDEFTKELKNAKPYLSKESFNDFSYALAVKNSAQEQAHQIYLDREEKAIWLQFSNAIEEENHTKIENLLASHLEILSIGSASLAASEDGQIALAQSLSYKALKSNDDNQNAYISMLNLVKQRSDVSDVKVSYYNRDPLLRKFVAIHNSNYINDGYYLLSDLSYYRNSDLNNNILRTLPDDTLEFNLGVKKQFDKAEFTFYGGYANSMDSYFVFSLFGNYQLTNRLTLGGGLYSNIRTDESTQLLLGGKKDKIELNALYKILNSTSLELLYQHNKYNSQDDVYLGDGNYIRASLGHQLRNGYPDMRLSLFTDYANYNEKSGSHGVIDKLQGNANQVLPNDFVNVGIDFAYGMQNSDIYTRVWRPYFDVSSYYNSDLAAFSYGFNAGYGGKVYSQDHLVIGISYTNEVNGIGGSIFELFLKYKFLYTHK